MTDAPAATPAGPPVTALEHALAAAREGALAPFAAFWALAASTVLVPLAPRDPEDAPPQPRVVSRGDLSFVVAFTTTARTGEWAAPGVEFLTLRGADLVGGLDASLGVVINPAGGPFVELPAEVAGQLRADVGVPRSVLARIVELTRAQELPGAAIAWTLAASELEVPSRTAPDGPDGLVPVGWGERGELVAVFTDAAAAQASAGAVAVARMPGADLVRALGDGAGIAIDPGTPGAAVLPPEAVALLRARLA